MARKKKEEKKEYEWSEYQKKIFDFIEHGQGNLVVEASAGAGKTSTLVKCLDFIPKDKKVLLVAFNKDIVNVLSKKTKEYDNVEVRTLHSLGLKMIKSNVGDGIKGEPEVFKYDAYIRNNLKELSSINIFKLKGSERYRYTENIKKYINFGRCYLCQTVKDLNFIEERYEIDTIADEKEVAIDALRWGRNVLETLDYGDMVWLPTALNLKPYGALYDFIFIDECQDLNKAERELILRCVKMGTRIFSFGDAFQTVYSFSGSDPQSFEALKNIPNTTSLPLSISYRCADSIVDFAKKIVPSIEHNGDGRIGAIKYDVPLSDIKDGDMILCRNNAPLIQIYNEFLKMGKKCYIMGKDIGSNLKNVVKSTKKDELNISCLKDGVFARLYDDIFSERDKMMVRCCIDKKSAMESQPIQDRLDMIRALEVLSDGLRTAEELETRIDEIFPKRDKKNGIALSTIHKAKGLEADNVYIVCRSLMPSKSAKKDWEKAQEQNLIYVAYTRAKNTLGFIDEKDFESFTMGENAEKKLQYIESLTNRLYGKDKLLPISSPKDAEEIIKKARKVTTRIQSSATISMNEAKETNKINNFSDILRRRTKKITIKR